jgi:hypothetical protein
MTSEIKDLGKTQRRVFEWMGKRGSAAAWRDLWTKTKQTYGSGTIPMLESLVARRLVTRTIETVNGEVVVTYTAVRKEDLS